MKYGADLPAQAKAPGDRFEFVCTPKPGSWRNSAEIEPSVMIGQCLKRRIDSMAELRERVTAGQAQRDRLQAKVNWQDTTDDARVEPKRPFPTFDIRPDTSVRR